MDFDDVGNEQPSTDDLLQEMVETQVPAMQRQNADQARLATEQRKRIADALERIAVVLEGWDRDGVPAHERVGPPNVI